MKKAILMLCIASLFSLFATAQNINDSILHKRWDAKWILADPAAPHQYGVYHFRKTVRLDNVPPHFIVHVSADNRYKLYVNGTMVSLGPARADLFHWNFETVDIAPYLKKGNNVLASVVWNFGEWRQEAQITLQTAFIMQGNTATEAIVNTDASWKCAKDTAYNPLPVDIHYAYYVAGPGERVDFNAYPQRWEQPDFNDESWKQASPVFNGLPKGVFDYTYGWMLVPRSIPQVELTPQRLQSVRTVSGTTIPPAFPATKQAFTVPANTQVSILLDQGFETNAYPVLQFSGGKGATITIGYTEALYKKEGDKVIYQKGNRNEVAGKAFVGVFDEVTADGKNNQTFTALSWRTFRYVQLTIQTSAAPLTINDFYGIYTGYPFQYNATFDAGDTLLNTILEVGWRTARDCAVETYMDCPYYEQLQYVGDTRIQALVSLYNSGDDRLMRNAIKQIHDSRLAEGITLSRYPSYTPQEIPPFSLWWIGMVHDYWMYRDDTAFVKQFLPGVRDVLTFFSRYQGGDGSLQHAPYWEFTDWSEGNGWQNGMPPLGSDGASAVLDFQLLWAYQLAAQLEEQLGMQEYAQLYKQKAVQLTQTINTKYWDEGRGLYADTKEHNFFSQHANTLAVLTGTVDEKKAANIANKLLNDTSLTQATVYFKYYVNRALVKAGLGDLYLDQLGLWKDNLAYGMTTWAEMSDINASRSDCHAWGASPNIELFRTVLGIDSDMPGFNHIAITPHLGKLKNASGSMPHPKGMIAVSYQLNNGNWQASIELPAGTDGTLHFRGKTFALKAGKNVLSGRE
ncbi:alpha-rhamnosidase [Ilyomonas limi]|uniref:Alpha-rhamnosidase n=1 Tax=Ilyomonas limi TaxID=2575867 RepID=A0A4U3KUV1_9BACT|nr:alpha-L-rhamnosidase C-terminal domain-containing protein [Ilyomonas limi]TKK65579.1 alpha-rhamnosidase [Ilyomonas limi]